MKPVHFASLVISNSPKLKRKSPLISLNRKRQPFRLTQPEESSLSNAVNYALLTPQKETLPGLLPHLETRTKRRNRSMRSSKEVFKASSCVSELQRTVMPQSLYTAKYSHRHSGSMQLGEADRRLAKFYEEVVRNLQ